MLDLDRADRRAWTADPGPRPVVVVVARAELQAERSGSESGAVNQVCVRLEPLPDDEAAGARATGGRAGFLERQRDTIVVRAGRSPSFIVESTGMLLREGAAARDDEPLIPPTVEAMVSSRLDGLPRSSGPRAATLRLPDMTYLNKVSDRRRRGSRRSWMSSSTPDRSCERRPRGGIAVWRFRHDVLREVAYASLPQARARCGARRDRRAPPGRRRRWRGRRITSRPRPRRRSTSTPSTRAR